MSLLVRFFSLVWQNRGLFFFLAVILPFCTFLYFNNQQHKIDSTIKLKGYALKDFNVEKFTSPTVKINKRKNKVLVTVYSSDREHANSVIEKTNNAIVSDIAYSVLSSIQTKLKSSRSKLQSLQVKLKNREESLLRTKDKYQQSNLKNDISATQLVLRKELINYKKLFSNLENFTFDNNIRVSVKDPIRNEDFGFKMFMSFLFAITLGLAISIIKVALDDTYAKASEIKEDLGIKTLEGLASFNKLKYVNNEIVSSHIKLYNLTEIARIFKYITSRKKQVIGIISSMRQEGNSSLAYSLAQHGSKNDFKVLIIDMDLKERGLSAIQKNSSVSWGLTQKTDYEKIDSNILTIDTNLDFLPALKDVKSLELLKSTKEMEKLFKHLKQKYDYVFIDTSPVSSVNMNNIDPIILSNAADGVIVNYLINKTPKKKLQSTIEKLKMLDSKILAIVTNRRYKARMKDELMMYCDSIAKINHPLSRKLKNKISKSYILDEE